MNTSNQNISVNKWVFPAKQVTHEQYATTRMLKPKENRNNCLVPEWWLTYQATKFTWSHLAQQQWMNSNRRLWTVCMYGGFLLNHKIIDICTSMNQSIAHHRPKMNDAVTLKVEHLFQLVSFLFISTLFFFFWMPNDANNMEACGDGTTSQRS